MKAFHIAGRTIMLRDHAGHQFHFAVAGSPGCERLVLAAPPRWKDGIAPRNPGALLELAAVSARSIAAQSGLV